MHAPAPSGDATLSEAFPRPLFWQSSTLRATRGRQAPHSPFGRHCLLTPGCQELVTLVGRVWFGNRLSCRTRSTQTHTDTQRSAQARRADTQEEERETKRRGAWRPAKARPPVCTCRPAGATDHLCSTVIAGTNCSRSPLPCLIHIMEQGRERASPPARRAAGRRRRQARRQLHSLPPPSRRVAAPEIKEKRGRGEEEKGRCRRRDFRRARDRFCLLALPKALRT